MHNNNNLIFLYNIIITTQTSLGQISFNKYNFNWKNTLYHSQISVAWYKEVYRRMEGRGGGGRDNIVR